MQAYLDAAGGIAADGDRVTEDELPPARAEKPFNPIRTPQRDERFTRVWNSRGRGPDADISASERNWYQLFIRLTEMHVPELMALIIYDWDDQPWAFYRDMARQLWDEARHAMMGEIAFEANGLDWAAVPHEISFGEFPNTQLEPVDRHCLLWGIEQGLMKPDGKQREYKVACESGDPLSITFQDFDWADEVLHAQIGRRWLLPAFESMEAMQQRYVKRFWSASRPSSTRTRRCQEQSGGMPSTSRYLNKKNRRNQFDELFGTLPSADAWRGTQTH